MTIVISWFLGTATRKTRCWSAASTGAGPVISPVTSRPLELVDPAVTWMSNRPSVEKLMVAASAATSAAEPLTLILPVCTTCGAIIAT